MNLLSKVDVMLFAGVRFGSYELLGVLGRRFCVRIYWMPCLTL